MERLSDMFYGRMSFWLAFKIGLLMTFSVFDLLMRTVFDDQAD